MNIWVVSTFWLLWIVLLLIFAYKFLCEHMFSSLGYIPRSRIAQSYGNMFNIWKSACFPKQFSTFYIPTSSVLTGVSISPPPCQHLLPSRILSYHSECEVILIMVLTCIFWWLMILSIFFMSLLAMKRYLYIFFEKYSLPVY